MADKSDTWMALYIGVYLADTMHLGRQHHGSYLLLIMAAFKNAGWLPNDDGLLMQIAKCTPKEWKAERGIYAAFFQVTDERWTHKRVTIEWEKAQRLTDQRRAAGTASAASRQRNVNDRSTSVPTERQQSARPQEEQLPKNSDPIGSGADAPQDDPVKRLFDEGVKLLTDHDCKPSNARSLIAKWRNEQGDEATMGALLAFRKSASTEPISWITQRLANKPRETWDQKRIREAMEAIRQ